MRSHDVWILAEIGAIVDVATAYDDAKDKGDKEKLLTTFIACIASYKTHPDQSYHTIPRIMCANLKLDITVYEAAIMRHRSTFEDLRAQLYKSQ